MCEYSAVKALRDRIAQSALAAYEASMNELDAQIRKGTICPDVGVILGLELSVYYERLPSSMKALNRLNSGLALTQDPDESPKQEYRNGELN